MPIPKIEHIGMEKNATKNGITLMKRYKVIRKPAYWPPHTEFGWLGKVGTAHWFYPSEDKAAVNLYFGNNIDRTLPCDCLEPVDDVNPQTSSKLDISTVKVGQPYRITGIPSFWKSGTFPPVGTVGKLLAARASGCVLCFNDEHTNQRFLTYDCIEAVNQNEPTIDDDVLVVQIMNNPWGALKIVKGLAKMNRDMKLVAFVERGWIS